MLERFRQTPSSPEVLDHPALFSGAQLGDVLADVPDFDDEPILVVAPGPERRWRRRLSALVVTVVAIAVTLAVTVAWGPDAGGLTGVITTMAATMYGYQVLRGCPGRR